MISVILLAIGSANFVPEAECSLVAEKTASVYFKDTEPSQAFTFVDLAGERNFHAYVYRLGESNLNPGRSYDDDDERWGVDRYATVIVGARYSQSPVIEISNALPARIANREKAVCRASELWSGLSPELTGYVYLAPLDEWFEFTTSEGKRYLGAYDMLAYDFSKLAPISLQQKSGASLNVHPGWQKALNAGFLLARQNKVEDVPYALWSYGCSPTASSMVLDYWDRRGYPRLVDYYFDRWDNVEQENDKDLTNVHRELAIGMHTDSMYSGGTSWNSMTGGHMYVCNSLHGYSFTGSTIAGSPATCYAAIIGEIDQGRPVHWAVGSYDYGGQSINHSVCAVGYEITSTDDSLVILHNTWDRGEHRWPYQTPGCFTMTYPLIPGGAQNEDLRLTWLNTTSILYKGIKYAVTFEKAGGLSEIRMWGAVDDKKSGWDQLAAIPGTGQDYAVIDLSDDLTGSRINLEGYSGGVLEAADGSVSRLAAIDFPSNPHFVLEGHIPADGSSSEDVILNGSIAYVSQGSAGLRVVELKGDYLATAKTIDAHAADCIAMDGDWLYVLGGRTLFLYNISTPLSPVLSDSVPLPELYGWLAVYDGRAYLGRVGSEIGVYRKDGAKLLGDVPLPETLVTGLDVAGGKLYVSAHRSGVNIYGLTDGTPKYERNVPTKGAAVAVARRDNILYVAEGGIGVEAINLESGSTNVFDPGSVYNLTATGVRVYLACGQYGLVVCKPGPDVALEKMGEFKLPYGSVGSIALGNGRLNLACGFDGFMTFTSDLIGIEEEPGDSRQTGNVAFNTFLHPGGSIGTIQMDVQAHASVCLYDVTGRQVMAATQELRQGMNSLPRIPELSRGVYFVKVEVDGKSSRAKVVVLK